MGIWGDDAASEVALDDGGGRPGGAARPGGTTGERPGGTAGRPGGAAGISFGTTDGGDCGEGISGAAEPTSESTATDDVGDRGGGGGGGAVSLTLACLVAAGVTGRFGKWPAGVAGRDDDACEGAFATPFLRISVIAGPIVAVVEPDRCCRVVVPARRVCRNTEFAALVLLCSAVLASVVLLLFAQDAARGRPAKQS